MSKRPSFLNNRRSRDHQVKNNATRVAGQSSCAAATSTDSARGTWPNAADCRADLPISATLPGAKSESRTASPTPLSRYRLDHEVTGTSPREAAELALSIQRDEQSLAAHFDVADAVGNV
jgi:hypothetical protein